ncbi:hypothetical protein [Marinicella sp. W31]|uniref:FG-GAP repeat protein n=1 Tax=Marinicella sp. W31 TaxID=3023713 RepID=UPI003757158C
MNTMLKHRLMVGILSMLCAQICWGNIISEDQKLVGQSVSSLDEFGRNIAVTNGGTRLLAGAPFDGSNDGSAYVFENNNTSWSETQRLISSDNATGDFFGAAVALQNNVAVVSATGDSNLQGAAYVFRFNGQSWVEEAKLTASDAEDGAQFGSSMKLEGDYLVIGAQSCCTNSQIGSAYVFEFDGLDWVEIAKLTASNGTPANRFGATIDIKNGLVVIGAPRSFSSRGAAYVFEEFGSSWNQLQGITPLDPVNNKQFGSSVTWGNDDRLLIGAANDNSIATRNGAVYVFERNAQTNRGGLVWSQDDKLVASDAASDNFFGGFNQGISVDGDFMVVTALEDREVVAEGGAAYLFKFINNNWIELEKFTASDLGASWFFGRSVIIQNNTILVGASGANTSRGAVYSFTNDLIFEDNFDTGTASPER